MRVLSSPPSRISLHAMAYRTRFTVTMGHSFRQIGNLTTKRRHRNFPFRKQAMPFLTVDAFSDNSRCHL